MNTPAPAPAPQPMRVLWPGRPRPTHTNCRACRLYLPFNGDNFLADATARHGLQKVCLKCHRIAQAKRRAKRALLAKPTATRTEPLPDGFRPNVLPPK